MPAPPPEVRRLRPSFIGIAGLACVLFLVLGSTPVLGAQWVVGLCVLWLLLLLVGVARFLTRPRLVAMLPVVGVVGWLIGVLVRRT